MNDLDKLKSEPSHLITYFHSINTSVRFDLSRKLLMISRKVFVRVELNIFMKIRPSYDKLIKTLQQEIQWKK